MSKWFYSESGQTNGPVSLKALIDKVLKNELSYDSYVTNGIDKSWSRIQDVKELMDLINKPLVPEQLSEYASATNKIGLDYTPNSIFYYIPLINLVFYNIVTCGLFQFYWLYRQLNYLIQLENMKTGSMQMNWTWILQPWLILEKIKTDRNLSSLVNPVPNLAIISWIWIIGGLAISGFIVIVILSSVMTMVITFQSEFPFTLFYAMAIVEGVAWILALWSSLFLLPVQNYINKANKKLKNKFSNLGKIGRRILIIFLLLNIPLLYALVLNFLSIVGILRWHCM